MFTKRGVVWLALLCASLCAYSFAAHVAAEDVTVSIGVGDTVLVVNGKTSPGAFVTIKSDDAVMGTTIASSDGTYSKTFLAQSPGLRKLSLLAHTPSGSTTDTVTLHLSVIEHATTTAEVFLPTTVTVEDAGLDHAQPLQLKGETVPFSTIKLFLDNTEYMTTSSDASGAWKISLNTDSLADGQHEFFMRVIDGLGAQSYPTVSRTFTRLATSPEVDIQPSIPGLPPKTISSPVITYPISGAMWDKPEITVRGTAPRNTQVELWDGTRLLGSAWSDSNGDWSITLALESQEYNLRARACIDNRCSDFSPMTSFIYHGSIQQALRIDVSQTSFTIDRDETLTIQAGVINGRMPYETKMQWGDERSDSSASKNRNLVFSHRYSKPGKYTAILGVQDAQGQKGSVQFAVYVRDASSPMILPYVILPITVLLLAIFSIRKWLLQRLRSKK